MKSFKRVVVTGIGALTPIGNTVPQYWEGLKNGVSGCDYITKFDAEKFRTRFACELKNFDITQFIPVKDARRMDQFTQYGIVASDEALMDSGLDLESVDKNKIGVIWGSGIGGLRTFEDEVQYFAKGEGTPKFNPFFIPKMIADSASGNISIRHGFRGPNYATVSACSSANNAIIDAFNYIRLGRINICVTGGSEAAVTIASVGGFTAMRAMSERNDDPKTASRPYDKDRDGFVVGEGAGALILEEYDHAIARGAKIYCELIGGGFSSDAYHITAPHPDGLGALLSMQDALDDAGIKPEEVDYINTHGTSTPLGDPQELKAIVDYALAKKMYVEINTHHEHWLKNNYDGTATNDAKFAKLWTGIATFFIDYPKQLIFDVLNEPGGKMGQWSGGFPIPTGAKELSFTRQVNKWLMMLSEQLVVIMQLV